MKRQFLLLSISLFFFSGCSAPGSKLGEDGERCFEDGRCKEGLVCLEDVCRHPSYDCRDRQCGLSPNIGYDCGTCPSSFVCENGICACREGLAGENCDRCAPGFIDYPECVDDPCDPDPCHGHGMCTGGACTCNSVFTGDYCDSCAPSHGGYPFCDSCGDDNSCQGNETCLLDIATVAAGWDHSCAITSLGGVKCWGENSSGQLGDGTRVTRLTPTGVTDLSSGVVSIAAGVAHTCAITSSGGVKCWGFNFYGQLGDGTQIESSVPIEVTGLSSGVQAIAAGSFHTCALTSSGGVKCWGSNDAGQLGDGTRLGRSVPTDVSGLSTGVVAVASGWAHTCALLSTGSLRCWGENQNGQLGNGERLDRLTPTDVTGLSSGVVYMAAGAAHTCAITSSGDVKCWGQNGSGQLGTGTYSDRLTPTDVIDLSSGIVSLATGGFHTCALATSGGVKCWGSNLFGELGDGTTITGNRPADVSGLSSGVTAISAGGDHTCALTHQGGVKCWGRNEAGQIGNGTRTIKLTPTDVAGLTAGQATVAAGMLHTCALSTLGGVKCWGGNYFGQLGDGTQTDRIFAADVTGLSSGVAAIAAGLVHTCALTSSGGVKCWGSRTDRLTPTDISGLSSGVMAIVAGWGHNCALTASGGVMCWGWNDSGQLGDGTTTKRETPTDVTGLSSGVVAMSAGGNHTCALTSSGGVKCWGENVYGQLGDGTQTTRLTTTEVTGLSSGVTAVAAGGSHSCAITASGSVNCWGSNFSGQLGNRTQTDSLVPTDVTDLSSGMAAIVAGSDHTCALTTTGGVKCWGLNLYGQLGDGTTETRLTPTDVAGLSSDVLAITAGSDHTCALTSSGGVKCWGWDEYGQLGDGTSGEPRVPKTSCDVSFW